MREFLKGLELDKETIDTIMAEHGKLITEAKEQTLEYKQKVAEYEEQVKTLNSKIDENSKSLENLQNITNENNDLKAEIQMNGSNVKKEFSKFVRSEVMASVNDDTNFETALENYKKENPQYFGETVVTKVQSSPALVGGQQPKTANDVMNSFIRNS